MKILVEIDIPEEGMARWREDAPPPSDYTDEQFRHALARALIASVGRTVLQMGFDFDNVEQGARYGSGYCVRKLAS